MAGITPDPIGGQGYANVFKGNRAIDDLREDIRYNRAKKDKVDAEKKAAVEKLAERNLIGWASTDQKELDSLYQKIQEDAQKYGVTPDVKLTMQKALGLAKASQNAELQYNERLKWLNDNQQKLDPDEFTKSMDELEAWRTQGGKAEKGEAGTTWARSLTPPPNKPELQTDWLPKAQSLVDKTKADITAVWKPGENITEEKKTYAKETIDANWEDYRTSDYYKAQAKQYAKEKGETDPEKVEVALKERYVDKLPSYVKEKFSRPPQGSEFSYGKGTTTYNGYKHTYVDSGGGIEVVTKKMTTEGVPEEVQNEVLQLPTKEQKGGLVVTSSLNGKKVAPQPFNLLKENGEIEVEDFRPYFIYKDGDKYYVIGKTLVKEAQTYESEGNTYAKLDAEGNQVYTYKEQKGTTVSELKPGANKENYEQVYRNGRPIEADWTESEKKSGGVQEFKVNGKTYKIPESEVADFKKEMGIK